ncbi:MAG: flagellar export protein FliJ [Campylobacterales bacterium]
MKTKYDKLVQVRKTQADRFEVQIAQIRLSIQAQELEVETKRAELSAVVTPSKGNVAILQEYSAAKKVMAMHINHLLNQLEETKKELHSTQLKYKLAMMEYEKSKHLRDTEIQKTILEMKKREQKDIDEIASQLFNNKKELF